MYLMDILANHPDTIEIWSTDNGFIDFIIHLDESDYCANVAIDEGEGIYEIETGTLYYDPESEPDYEFVPDTTKKFDCDMDAAVAYLNHILRSYSDSELNEIANEFDNLYWE